MTYQQTTEWMFSKLPMYQKEGKTAFKKDLTNIIALSQHLNNPHKNFKSIHIAGTNGKGSTSHMIASVLQEAGYNVGLYTSPHLKDFRERIKFNGTPISEEEVIQFVTQNKEFLEEQKLSFFEMTVGLAFHFFAEKKVDFAVVEVGLGGRLDSTNIITPEVSVITNIGYDHTQFLGKTLSKISIEKAGVIKPNIPVVIGEYHKSTIPVFRRVAKKNEAPLFLAEREIKEVYKTDLRGSYQEKNVKTAVKAIQILQEKYKISSKNIEQGLLKVVENTGLLGRWQILQEQPKVICDTAHNKEGLLYTMKQISDEVKGGDLHIVLGFVNDKNLDIILPLLPRSATYYFCKPNVPRGLDKNILKKVAITFGLKGKTYLSVEKAYKKALSVASNKDIIYVGGSTFVVAEVI
ncbi:MAG: bifunctional folylpolyglutamate synthase/dihydrofolate synthase [Flavobacteriaceae bacterium]|nr:bifunctional folylpolyglutamate synthase/dihydrofolate synthase [Flavobacteriaceae bacterium]